MTDDRTDYFDFVINVLGIKSVLLTEGDLTKEPVPLLFLVENYATYNNAEIELLEKMISSVKVDLSLIKVADLQLGEKIPKDYVVYFLDKLSKVPELNEKQLKVFSPRVLLTNTDLKKQAWNDLQKVIKYFATPRPKN